MYEQFYKFTARPFQLTPDAHFFFNSRTHKRALAYLRYGIEQGEGFIVVTGDVGTGKTTLVARLFQAFDTRTIVAARLVSTQIQADDLLRLVAAEFGLPFDRLSKAAILHKLEHYFRACVQEGKRVLLVVDEAQNLTKRAIEELRMLSNFHWKGRPLLQSLLLGQREFRQMMRSEGMEQLRQRVLAAYHLQPLDASETQQYIEHRLRMVGWDGDPYIQDEVYAKVYEFTGGVPRKTNLLFDRVLLYGCLEELHHINQSVIDSVLNDVKSELWSAEPELGQVHHAVEAEPSAHLGADSPGIAKPLGHESRLDAAPASQRPTVDRGESGPISSLVHELREELRKFREEIHHMRDDEHSDDERH